MNSKRTTIRFNGAKAAFWLGLAALVLFARRFRGVWRMPDLEPIHLVALAALVLIAIVGIIRILLNHRASARSHIDEDFNERR